MYDVYLDKVLLPVSPSQLQVKISNKNQTVTLIDEGEINIPKKAGLTDISFTALLPNVKYPFAQYVNGFQHASFYTEHFKKLKIEQKTFQFIVARAFPNGKTRVVLDSEENPFIYNEYSISSTNIKVTLEDYTIKEDASNGFDWMVDIRLKEFRPYNTKIGQIVDPADETAQPQVVIQPERPAETAPQANTYTVTSGDTLWAIAKKYYNNGNDYSKIYEANKDKVSNANLINPGLVLTIP